MRACQVAGVRPEQASIPIDRLINQQAFTMAATDVFTLSVWLPLLLIPVVWLMQKDRRASDAGPRPGAHSTK